MATGTAEAETSCQPQPDGRSLQTLPSLASLPSTEATDSYESVGPSSFESLGQVGAGSFGKVHKVRHTGTGNIFAMKTLRRDKLAQGNLMKYAVTERKVMAFAKHPYIVQLFYSFEAEKHIGLVMTYCPRGDLHHLLKKLKAQDTGLSVERTRHYAAEVLLALCYLHTHKILYRDLKPANIILDSDWHALLTDFGLSKEAAEGTVAKSFVGSLAFMAPEILTRKGHDHTVDIYGLGVNVYTMLTGLPPFFTTDVDELKRSIRRAPLVCPEQFDHDTALFVSETMHRTPSLRLGAEHTADVQKHSFFKDIDWNALFRREVPVPDVERIEEHPSKNEQPSKARARFCICFK